MADKKRVALIFGSKSEEHEVTTMSAANVLNNFEKLPQYEVIKVGITKQGRWYITDASAEEIKDGSWVDHDNKQVAFPHDPTIGGMLVFDDKDNATVEKIDIIFPCLHGDTGEDGIIQGLLELCEIPYVGCGVMTSAVAMDKSITKAVVAREGITQAKCFVLKQCDYEKNKIRKIKEICDFHENKYPLFVKPASKGSSVGTHKVSTYEELVTAIEEAFTHDIKILIEKAISGRELEVAVLGNDSPQASLVGEILSAGEFYDYDSKYVNAESSTHVVDDLPSEVIEQIRLDAIKIYKALDCAGLSRVDFFFSDEGEIVFNEINTMPGFTNISMYPQLWADRGIDGPELIDRLLKLALEEHSNWVRD